MSRLAEQAGVFPIGVSREAGQARAAVHVQMEVWDRWANLLQAEVCAGEEEMRC